MQDIIEVLVDLFDWAVISKIHGQEEPKGERA